MFIPKYRLNFTLCNKMENNNKKHLISPSDKCAQCKYLNAFICEHNKPVRDSLKLVTDPETNRISLKYGDRPLPVNPIRSEESSFNVKKPQRKEAVPEPEKGGCCTIL